MADRGQGRDLNLVLLVLEEPIDALLLGVLEHQNQETAGNQRVQSVQLLVVVFQEGKVLDEKVAVCENGAGLTRLQLVEKYYLNYPDINRSYRIPVVVINVDFNLVRQVQILAQADQIIKCQGILVHHERDLVERGSDQEQAHLDRVLPVLGIFNEGDERDYLGYELSELED